MELPEVLQNTLSLLQEEGERARLLAAAEELSRRYRRQEGARPGVRNREEALAYALSRMPATFSAVGRALQLSIDCFPELKNGPVSLLDAGAGTGAASWAAGQLLSLSTAECWELSRPMAELGKAMMKRDLTLQQAQWRRVDLTGELPDRPADVVIAAYVLNELPEPERRKAVTGLWNLSERLLLLVEPGTPEGFLGLKSLKEFLLPQGARVLAPCPTEGSCPLGEKDWCHFTVRVQRSRFHRQAKGGEAPYEDEKFCFLALSREKASPGTPRVLRHPYSGKGFLRLELCSAQGLLQRTVTRREGGLYQAARKASAGDLFPL